MLATAVSNAESQSLDTDFTPFDVYYAQTHEAAGLVQSGVFSHASQEILVARMIDRSLRPLFPADYKHGIELSCNMLEFDSINRPEVLGINASSLALALSDIPWNGPIGAAR